MSITTRLKKLVFDMAKKNKQFRVTARWIRDNAYRAKMVIDDPFCKIDDKLVYFQTFSGRGYSDSPKAMYEYMLLSPEYKDYRFVWSFKEPEKFGFLLNNERTSLVKFRTREDNIALRSAKYWISNYRMLDHQFPRRGQVYLQCWHGTPLKRLGYDIKEGDNVMNTIPEIREKYRTDAKKFSFLLSPSPFATEKFASAWNLNETAQRHKILEEGYPRNDRLINYRPEERDDIRRTLGVDGKRVILYAPTWRDNQHISGQGYTYKIEIDFDKLRSELGDDYILLFRSHYLIANSFDFNKYKDFVIDASSYHDINDLYIASDILVTDYSSVFFDYLNLGRPIVFYMYDLEKYDKEMRGFYISMEDLPGPIVREEQGLIEEIKLTEQWQVSENYKTFHEKYNPFDDGHATERLVRRVIDPNKTNGQ